MNESKMNKSKILIVEDETRVVQFLKQGFEENGFEVDVAYDGKFGEKLALSNGYDIFVLDVIIPHLNGLKLCKIIRDKHPESKIIMLTALGSLDDKLEGFEAGADDYLIKPFDFPELLARVKSLLRRTNNSTEQPTDSNHILSIGDLELNTFSKIVKRAGNEVKLTAKEYTLLELLLQNKNRVISKAEIAEKVWDITFDSGTNVIEVYVNFLRKKIDNDYPNKLIHTHVGLGYSIKED